MTGLVVFAHGSPLEDANQPVRDLTERVAQQLGCDQFETSFLDCAQPDLPEAVARLTARGCTRVVIVPFFLTLGMHLRRDLPRIVAGLRDIYPSVAIEVAPPLEGHAALSDIVLDRAKEILNGGGSSESKAGGIGGNCA